MTITAASVFDDHRSGAADPRAFIPIDDLGKLVEPNPHFDDWDQTPHAYFFVGVGKVAAGDVVLGGTHQVEGFGRANQRGTDAIRLDLDFVAAPSMEKSARLILPVDHQLEIKRYTLTPYRWAYVKVMGETRDAGLIADYGSDSGRCLCNATGVEGHNADGFEIATTMCNDCVDSWEADYDVVRHYTDPV